MCRILVILWLMPLAAFAEFLKLEDAIKSAKSHPAVERQITSGEKNHLEFLHCHEMLYNDNQNTTSWNNLPRYELMHPLAARELEIIRRFFDVVLSDLDFVAKNENMAIAFIAVDRARVRSELGQFSEVEVAELEAKYQVVRQARFASEKSQRMTRSKLAAAMGDIDKLTTDLNEPEFEFDKLSVPNLNQIFDIAVKHNPVVNSFGSNSRDGKLAKMALKQQILNLILRLELLGFAKDNSAALSYYRDIYLDRSRALYEMEVKSDLGESVVWQSRALQRETAVDYCIALTYAELNALQNKAVWPVNEKQYAISDK